MFSGMYSIEPNSEEHDRAKEHDPLQPETTKVGDKEGHSDMARGNKNFNLLEELVSRVQDLETTIKDLESANTNDIPMPLLSDNASQAEIIEAVNRLIKLTLTYERLK